MKRCFRIDERDNVATMLTDASQEVVEVVGAADCPTIEVRGQAPLAHKVALREITAGGRVIKFGVAIGIATKDILPGEWVHLHNCRSQVDERSSKFEDGVESGSEANYA
ncbi:MAG: UxaA family hydrolase [Bryobacterales bacterium]|nr:UxaA family hydrolase [Bryobacterales bacterium]MEB2363313.1 UxaA family hydrolase [Bryobacterales bacterium]